MTDVLNSEVTGRKGQHNETRPRQAAQEVELGPKSIERTQLLDKEGLAAKLLESADERLLRGGQVCYANDAKDRLGFLRLYSEVMGFIGKASIEATGNNFTNNNELRVVLVRPEAEHDNKAIEPTVNKVDESATIIPLVIKPV